MKTTARQTWKPTVAGILDIVAGAFGLMSVVGILIALVFIPATASTTITVLTIVAVYSGIVGILPLVGGIYAVKRGKWGLALAGSIAAIFLMTLLGLLSTIFTALAQDEFE